jgi:hypothetical protein
MGQVAHNERPEAVRVAEGVEPVAEHQHGGESAFQFALHAGDGVLDLEPLADMIHGYQAADELRVVIALEHHAVALQPGAELAIVDEVAVGSDGHYRALGQFDGMRLRVERVAAARGGIAHVADGGIAGKPRLDAFVQHLLHQPHAFMGDDSSGGVLRGRAAAFLPAVLYGEEDRGDQTGRPFGFEYAGYAAHAAPP